MVKKNVTVYTVELQGANSFRDVLLNTEFHNPVRINQYKTSELKFIQEHSNGTITGLFVTTQKKGLPPAHKPGEDNDYTAIPLGDGKGLAYPNTILYDSTTNTMYIETNRIGVNAEKICEYFKIHSESISANISITLAPILKTEAYERVQNMSFIDSMECKVANPTQLIRNQMENGSIKEFGILANQLNATKTISIVVKSEEEVGGINKIEALKFIDFFSRFVNSAAYDRRNKLAIKGRKNSIETNEGELVEEDVNFFLDKIKDSFTLDEPNIASDLQPTDRKNGITLVYNRCRNEVTNIVGRI